MLFQKAQMSITDSIKSASKSVSGVLQSAGGAGISAAAAKIDESIYDLNKKFADKVDASRKKTTLPTPAFASIGALGGILIVVGVFYLLKKIRVAV